MIMRAVLPAIGVLAVLAANLPAAATAQTVDTTAVSQEAKTPKDVDVEADQMEVFDKESKAIFKGNVIAKRSTTTLKCDTLVVTYKQTEQSGGEKKTEVTFLDATGNTTILTSRQTVTGEKARMDVKANTVTVEGNVKVVQGKTVITGQRLVSDLNSNKSEMTGGRVKGSFVPGE
jgi:lipopolysaccharide export system protein LptA